MSLTSTDPDILEPEYHHPHRPLNEYYIQPKECKILFDIRMFICIWSRDFGPIACWPHSLQLLHDEAAENGAGEKWRGDLKDKVRQGLMGLGDLKDLFLELPTDTKWMVQYIWSQAFDLAMELQNGIACLQTHLALYGD
jgi:hypothetical protein